MSMHVTYTNGRGESIEFGGSPPFIFLGLDELNHVTAKHATLTVLDADGAVYSGSVVETNTLTLKVLTKAGTPAHMQEHRRRLMRVFNPKAGEGRLTVSRTGANDLYIRCAVDEVSKMHAADGASLMREDSIDLYCFDPYWREDDVAVNFSSNVGGFHFDFAVPAEGIPADYRTIDLVKHIPNEGDEPAGAVITITASGNVKNPAVACLTTGTELRLSYTMTAGETITISTEYDKHTIESSINGDIVDYFDLTSDWVQIEPGEQTYIYSADEGVDYLGLSLTYAPKLLGW